MTSTRQLKTMQIVGDPPLMWIGRRKEPGLLFWEFWDGKDEQWVSLEELATRFTCRAAAECCLAKLHQIAISRPRRFVIPFSTGMGYVSRTNSAQLLLLGQGPPNQLLLQEPRYATIHETHTPREDDRPCRIGLLLRGALLVAPQKVANKLTRAVQMTGVQPIRVTYRGNVEQYVVSNVRWSGHVFSGDMCLMGDPELLVQNNGMPFMETRVGAALGHTAGLLRADFR
jgi:hypothetical protein